LRTERASEATEVNLGGDSCNKTLGRTTTTSPQRRFKNSNSIDGASTSMKTRSEHDQPALWKNNRQRRHVTARRNRKQDEAEDNSGKD
jgi:hypothetical protein